MKKTRKIFGITIIALFILQSCAIIQPGEVGVDVHFGKTQKKLLEPGPHHFMALFGRRIVRFDTRVINYAQTLSFHTKEGIEIASEITILYHVNKKSVVNIYEQFGTSYQEKVIEDNLITILRKAGLDYIAIELITERNTIEKTIHKNLVEAIGKYGFEVDLVMLREVELPANVIATIQAKLNAEEIAKKTIIENEIKRNQLDFLLEKQLDLAQLEIDKERLVINFSIEKQEKEAERLLIEAEAIKKQQAIVNSTLTDKLIRLKSLEITEALVKSDNTKVIISDGKSPVILNE